MKQKLLRMRHAWYLLPACLTLLIPWGGEMQAAPSPQQTSVRVENVTSLKGLIQEIESQTSYRISYQGNLADNVPVKIAKSTKSVSQLLDEALRGTGITYIIRQNNIILTRAEALTDTVTFLLFSPMYGSIENWKNIIAIISKRTGILFYDFS